MSALHLTSYTGTNMRWRLSDVTPTTGAPLHGMGAVPSNYRVHSKHMRRPTRSLPMHA